MHVTQMNRIHVVLHRPIYPRNVGMCARAIGNLGAGRLVIVAPQFDMAAEELKQGAVHAQSVLREATVYASHADFLANEGEGLRIALSGRDGSLMKPEGIETALDRFVSEPGHLIQDHTTPIYLIFGTEDDGLSNEEMELCHQVCRLPSTDEVPSFNLSHAVLLTLYIVRSALQRLLQVDPETVEVMTTEDQASSGVNKGVYYPSDIIKRWLEALGFDLSAKRVNIEKTLNRIILSRCPTPEELRLLDTVLQQTVRKLRGK